MRKVYNSKIITILNKTVKDAGSLEHLKNINANDKGRLIYILFYFKEKKKNEEHYYEKCLNMPVLNWLQRRIELMKKCCSEATLEYFIKFLFFPLLDLENFIV